MTLRTVAMWLIVIGGLNWLLVAFGFNVIEAIFQPESALTKLVYILVGLSALYALSDMLGLLGKKH